MIGEEVRRQREQLGLTGAQLAARAGMAPSAVSQIETGKRTPSSTSVIKLAAALNVAPGDLYPKAQAPLPLEDTERAVQRGIEEAQRDLAEAGPFYTEYEALGRVLASSWCDDLRDWEEKIPEGKIPDSFDFGRLLQWALEIGSLRHVYKVVISDSPRVEREELQDTLKLMEAAEQEALGKVKRVFEPAKTFVEFRKMWNENGMDAVLSNAEVR